MTVTDVVCGVKQHTMLREYSWARRHWRRIGRKIVEMNRKIVEMDWGTRLPDMMTCASFEQEEEEGGFGEGGEI